MPASKERPKLVVMPELCKGCGRCIDACPKHGIAMGTEINQASGHTPIVIDYTVCNHCGLCISACPEPYGLVQDGYELEDPSRLYGEAETPEVKAVTVPDRQIPLRPCEPMVLKGTYAAAIGAVLGGCRHVYGYPITPSSEGAELMASLQPNLHGTFLQAVSEVATVNHMYGCGGAGLPSMTFTSSPGFSLMLEGISYMIGSEVPAVFMNVMRGGPGLGNIGPAQADIKLMCRGIGHGDTHAIVLAPSSPQEMLDLTMDAFRLSFKYRNPVIVTADGDLGQITGRVRLPDRMIELGLPDWAVYGDADHRHNLINSILLHEPDLEAHNEELQEKFQRIREAEQRSAVYRIEEANVLILAANTPARTAKGAVEVLRREGIAAGLFQPLTLWPFPIDALKKIVKPDMRLVVVEASAGQLEDEVRLALSHAGIGPVEIHHVRRMGGIMPQLSEVVDKVREVVGVHTG